MEPLREYVLYTDAIKSALKSRDSVQMEYEVTLEELNRKRAEREEVKKDVYIKLHNKMTINALFYHFGKRKSFPLILNKYLWFL